jgi:hypothetical protein
MDINYAPVEKEREASYLPTGYRRCLPNVVVFELALVYLQPLKAIEIY